VRKVSITRRQEGGCLSLRKKGPTPPNKLPPYAVELVSSPEARGPARPGGVPLQSDFDAGNYKNALLPRSSMVPRGGREDVVAMGEAGAVCCFPRQKLAERSTRKVKPGGGAKKSLAKKNSPYLEKPLRSVLTRAERKKQGLFSWSNAVGRSTTKTD